VVSALILFLKQPPQMELSAEAFAKGGDSDLLVRRCYVSVSTHNHSTLV
jgi:hypothetical protein